MYALNAAVLAPALPWATWHWSGRIALLYGASVLTMVVVVTCAFDLLVHGSAAAVTTGQAMSPLPAVAFGALLLETGVSPLQAGVAVLVVAAVLLALGDAFGALTRRRALATVAVAATGAGLLSVLTKLLVEEGAGVVEIYVVRTSLAAAIWLVLSPPRNVPLAAGPRLAGRALAATFYWLLVLLAIERGSPVTVQTLLATAPLMLLVGRLVRRGERPPPRVAFAALAVTAGIFLIFAL